MNEGGKPRENKRSMSILKAILGLGEDKKERPRKYGHYLFVISVLVILMSVLALVNAYFHFNTMTSYNIIQEGVSSSYLLAGYIGMFFTIWISPIPDYVLVPVYGYLSSIGIFNPFATFLVCLIGAILPIEYLSGRLAARPLLLKGLSYLRITEKDIEMADKWLVEHGKFSIFIATFIPFFYSVTSLASGTLKMNPASFFLTSIAGFGLRFAFLEYVGYYGIYIFTASFDYSQRNLFFLLLILSTLYAALYLVGRSRFTARAVSAS